MAIGEAVSLGTAISEENKAKAPTDHPITGAVDNANRLKMWMQGQKNKADLAKQKEQDVNEGKLQAILNHVSFKQHEKVLPGLKERIAPLLLTASDRSLPFPVRQEAANKATYESDNANALTDSLNKYDAIPVDKLSQSEQEARSIYQSSPTIEKLQKGKLNAIDNTGFNPQTGLPVYGTHNYADVNDELSKTFGKISQDIVSIAPVKGKSLYEVHKELLPESINNAKNRLWSDINFRESYINNNYKYIKDKFIKDGVPISTIKGGTSPFPQPTTEQLTGLLKDHPTVLKDLQEKFNSEVDDYSKTFFTKELRGIPQQSEASKNNKIFITPTTPTKDDTDIDNQNMEIVQKNINEGTHPASNTPFVNIVTFDPKTSKVTGTKTVTLKEAATTYKNDFVLDNQNDVNIVNSDKVKGKLTIDDLFAKRPKGNEGTAISPLTGSIRTAGESVNSFIERDAKKLDRGITQAIKFPKQQVQIGDMTFNGDQLVVNHHNGKTFIKIPADATSAGVPGASIPKFKAGQFVNPEESKGVRQQVINILSTGGKNGQAEYDKIINEGKKTKTITAAPIIGGKSPAPAKTAAPAKKETPAERAIRIANEK